LAVVIPTKDTFGSNLPPAEGNYSSVATCVADNW
jgi:hypothetical protein